MNELHHRLVVGPLERESPFFVRLVEFLDLNLHSMRAKNDSTGLSDLETAALRGKIDLIKQIQGEMRPAQSPNKVVDREGKVSFPPVGKTAGRI